MGSVNAEATTTPAAASGAKAESGYEAATSRSAPTPLSADDLRFELLRNAAYHADRLGFFSGLYRVISFIVVVLGTGAAATALTSWPGIAAVAGAVVALLTSLDLVLDLRGQARSHERMRARTFDILADVESHPNDANALRADHAALVRLYGEEGSDMFVVGAMAYNAAVQATQRHVMPDDLIPLTLRQRFLRHLFRQPGAYLTKQEMKATAPQAEGAP